MYSRADIGSGLSPVRQSPPNGYGLYGIAGNAWGEWVWDAPPDEFKDPRGPPDEDWESRIVRGEGSISRRNVSFTNTADRGISFRLVLAAPPPE